MKSSVSLWHHQEIDQVLEYLKTDAKQGLTIIEAETRQQQLGRNRLSPPASQSHWRLLLSQFNQPLIYILLCSGCITAFLGEWIDASVILTVVLANACIGYSQEAGALNAIRSLNRQLNPLATVIRHGQQHTVAAENLVPGDLILLRAGEKVPADLRLINCHQLCIDESILTGESVPIEKKPATLPKDTVLAERCNMAFSSSLITHGEGLAVVVATGDHTEIGLINQLLSHVQALETPLTHQLELFSQRLLWIIIAMAVLTFGIGVWRGEDWLQMFMAAIALSVGAIPEGLPAAMTITLAIGVSRMAKRNAIIRKLPAVETLGSTTVICSDKTGTLTQNRMTVQIIMAGQHRYSSPSSAQDSHTISAVDTTHNLALLACLKAGVLCNDADLILQPDGWQHCGDPTETALLMIGHHTGLIPSQLNQQYPRLDSLSFSAERQFMATLHQTQSSYQVYLKGSIEALLPRCRYQLDSSGSLQPLDAINIVNDANELAQQGLRVLAFAQIETTQTHLDSQHLMHNLIFLGLQAMMDPPRPEAAAAIQACYQAGIQVKMITGDHPLTALAIARQLGMHHNNQVLSGQDLMNLNPASWQQHVKHCAIFARISPEQKLLLVKAMQANGEVVAMTGDGINDAPALRQANIGIAMGHNGSDVAKEAAAMILTDDHFATIRAAIEEGRGVYDNLIKFIIWTLPTNLGEGLVITAAVVTHVALPITALQILWINMTTAVLLGLTLAFEPKEKDLMQRRPRHPQQPIFTQRLALRIVLVGILLLAGAFGLFEWELSHQESLEAARTSAVNVFVFGQMFYLLNCRSLRHSLYSIGIISNRWLLAGLISMTALQLLFSYWSPMQKIFGTQAIDLEEWVLIMLIGFSIHSIIGLEKWLLKSLHRH